MRIVSRPLRQPHFGQQRTPLRLDLLQDRPLVLLEIGPLLGQKLLGQGDIFQRRVLGKQVEGLEHHAEVEPLFADLALPLGGGVARVKEDLVPDQDPPPVGGLQKVQAAQQRRLSAAGGADDGQGLALLQLEADVLQHPGVAEMLLNVLDL